MLPATVPAVSSPAPVLAPAPFAPGQPAGAPPPVPASPAHAPPAPAPPPAPPEPPIHEASPALVESSRGGQQSGNFSWSRDGERLEVKYRGEIEFADDDTDVRSITPGGWLQINDGRFRVEFASDASGTLTRRFWTGGTERPFEPEGRKWTAQVLPRFIRQSGAGAAKRVARILKARGSEGVLEEIALIEGSWARREYYTELLKTPLDAATAARTLADAGRRIESDFELATLLIFADRFLVDEAPRRAYLEAARTIQSDFEMRRALAAAIDKGPPVPALLASLLETSMAIESDFELATLLVQVAKGQSLEPAAVQSAFFTAAASVANDFEHRRVLSAVLARGGSPDTVAAALQSVGQIASDFESATILQEVAREHAIEGAIRAPFFKAVSGIGSAHERGRVLLAVARRSDASDGTVLEVIRSAGAISSGHERSQVLIAVAKAHALGAEARAAYIDAAAALGEFEQGRALSALVARERSR
jgi:hypothetical protein